MHTAVHGLISAKAGEPVRIIFTVTNADGAEVDVSGASAVYKIARRAGEAALLTRTHEEGILLSGNMAVVEFDTGDLADDNGQMTGDFVGQLTVAMDGDSLVVAEGPVHVGAVIA